MRGLLFSFPLLLFENSISDPEHIPGRTSDSGGCAKTTCADSVCINDGQIRCPAVPFVPKAACGGLSRHDYCRRILPSSPSPRYGEHARRAAARDPRRGEIPMTRPSQPDFRQSPLAPGEVVSNTGADKRLKSLDFRSHGDRPRTIPVFVKSRHSCCSFHFLCGKIISKGVL